MLSTSEQKVSKESSLQIPEDPKKGEIILADSFGPYFPIYCGEVSPVTLERETEGRKRPSCLPLGRAEGAKVPILKCNRIPF